MMNQNAATRNSVINGVAGIATLDLVATALERLTSRHGDLPGLGVLYGPAGWGKSFCANTIANQERGYFVQMKSAWRGKALLEKILFEMGLRAKGTVAQLLDQVCAQLGASRRPLIIDEFDHCAKSDALVELVRDIYEGSRAAILLIGEEGLPATLERWERFHSRVLSWVPAQPISLGDAAKLAPIYCPEVDVAEDVIAHLVKIAGGSVRRVSVNLTLLHGHCMTMGLRRVDLATWGDQPFYTGRSPERRV
jgi:hypothetical protein